MAFQGNVFLVEKHIFFASGGPNMVPKWSPTPPSIPIEDKQICHEAFVLSKNKFLMISMFFMQKSKKSLINHFWTSNNFILGDGLNKCWSLFFPPSSPSPASAKVACQVANKLEKIYIWWFSMVFMKKVKKSPARVLGIGYWVLGIVTYVRIKSLN